MKNQFVLFSGLILITFLGNAQIIAFPKVVDSTFCYVLNTEPGSVIKRIYTIIYVDSNGKFLDTISKVSKLFISNYKPDLVKYGSLLSPSHRYFMVPPKLFNDAGYRIASPGEEEIMIRRNIIMGLRDKIPITCSARAY
ncbi:MAG: hypothetical protein JWQ09_2864 [Segetibacter sp.]|nr:hypothetical protein [Segetibacter sp.]